MERRFIYALLLSLGVLYLWNVVINPPPPPPPVEEGQPAAQVAQPAPKPEKMDAPLFDEPSSEPPAMLPPLAEKKVEPAPEQDPAQADDATAKLDADPQEGNAPTPPAPVVPKVEPPKEQPERFITLENDLFKAVFSSHGAKLKSCELKSKKFSEAIPDSDERMQVDLVTTDHAGRLPYALLLEQANFQYSPDQSFEVASKSATSVTFRSKTPQGVTIEKRFSMTDKDYLLDMNVSVINGAGAAVSFFPKVRLVGFQDDRHVQSGMFGSMPMNLQIPKAFISGELWEEEDPSSLEQLLVKKGDITWTGIDNRYFLMALIPPEGQRSQVDIKTVIKQASDEQGKEFKETWLGITHSLAKQELQAGQNASLDYKIYVGPKGYDRLRETGYHLEESVDFWVLGVLAKPMLWFLIASQSVVVNWGLAIIILTVVVKLLLYPLTRKSFQSMQKMKDLKPKLDAIKEKVGDDKQALNQQMMELYKQEGVNPLGGCLPMLLQMPVFIALYKVLQNSVELYNAAFIPGWLDDLVQPDPYYILPVLLGVMMFVQQKMTPTPDSQQQKMMMYMMPAMMFFFMLMLPSGLVLYILANTVVSLGQQWWINKKAQEEKAKQATA